MSETERDILYFFSPFPRAQARGISVEDFLRRQEEISQRFDSGFHGYRGLNGEWAKA